MSTVDEIYEKAKALPAPLQQEALNFVRFLATRESLPKAQSPEFSSELMQAFAEAKEAALKRPGN